MGGLTSTQRIILTIMKKHLTILCNLACLVAFITVLSGCDQPADKPASPKVVRKKIHSQTAKKARPPETQSPKKSKPAPKATQSAKPVDTAKQAPQQPVIAKKPERSAVKSKPPVRPKSDISVALQPSTSKPAGSTDIDQKAMASASAAQKAISASTPPSVYDPKGKIDPFEPLFSEKPTEDLKKSKRKKRAPRTPLERIDISQLKLVAIVMADSGNRALVEESSGKGYVIRKGTYMGTNSGKVVKIEKNKVIVAEEFEDYRGNVTLRNREIKLPKPPGEL